MMTGLFRAAAVEASRPAGRSEAAVRAVAADRAEIEALRLDVEKLYMITEAFWIILKDRHGYSDEQLGEMIREIDLRSGRLDGRRRKQPNPVCPECRRTLISKHSICLYCGAEVARDPFEG